MNSHLSLAPCELVQIANSCSQQTVGFFLGVRRVGCQARKGQHTWTVKIDQHKFCHLKQSRKVIYLILIKITYFYVVKQKNRKKLLFFFFLSNKTVTIKLHLSENLTFQNLLKIIKPLAVEKFGNILAFDKESKRKLLPHISADSFTKNNIAYTFRVEIFVMFKWKTF